MAGLSWLNPYTGAIENNIMVALADHTGMQTLHMVTADPFRTPTFTPFADPNWFFFATGATPPALCATPDARAFIPARTNSSFAWNHGDIQDEIASTWVGYVGHGVEDAGIDRETWSDHTDVRRPTILNLVGLKEDYVHDGPVIFEIEDDALPPRFEEEPWLHRARANLQAAERTLPPVRDGHAQRASTKARASNDPGDATSTSIEGQIQSLTARRDALATEMKGLLNGAEFNGQPFNALKALLPSCGGVYCSKKRTTCLTSLRAVMMC